MIKFGTSGWRGLIARDFTFASVRLASQAIADYLLAELQNPASAIHGREPEVIIGHDTRFLGRHFSLAVAEVLERNGLKPLLCDRDTPTPVISHNIRVRKAIGGINMTASHNPAEYQGLKFSTFNGAPAIPEVTAPIEINVARAVRPLLASVLEQGRPSVTLMRHGSPWPLGWKQPLASHSAYRRDSKDLGS